MYSIDLRNVALRLYKIWKNLRKVGNLLNIHFSTISRWFNSTFPKVRKERLPKLYKTEVINVIKASLIKNPFFTVNDILNKIKSFCNFSPSKEFVRLAMKKLGYTKKVPRFYPITKTTDEKTKIFLEKREKYKHFNFVSIDEVGFSSNVKPNYGYSIKGERLHIKYKPTSNEKKHISVVASIDKNGKLHYNKVNGFLNSYDFINFIKSLPYKENTVYLLDNASIHHSNMVKDYINKMNIILIYTPPYSPWFNPIERFFSVVKNNYRKNKNINLSFNTINKTKIINFMNSSSFV